MAVERIVLLLFAVLCIKGVVLQVTIGSDAKQFVMVGNEIQLTCHYNTSPPASEVLWRKDEAVISRNNTMENGTRGTITHFNESSVELTISSSIADDTGNYTCVVIKGNNNSTDTASVIIQVVLQVTIGSDAKQFVMVGNEIQLTCHYNTSPPASEVLWRKDEAVISRNNTMENGTRGTITHFNESSVELTISSSIADDTGNYTCVVIKGNNNSTDTASVIIQVVPSPPQNVIVVSQSSRVVNISWTAGFDGNSEILNYTVEISTDNQNFIAATCQGLLSGACVLNSSFTSASLTGLHPGKTYYIRVFATNKVGLSAASSIVNTTTDEEAPNAPPTNVLGRNTSSTSILVQWGKVPVDSQNGIIVNYTVTYVELPSGNSLTKIVNAPTNQTWLTGLKKYTNYSIAVHASTAEGDGNFSEPIVVITDEDTPSAPPVNVRGHNTSSTSILVQWGNVPEADRNGKILSYTVAYRVGEGHPLTKVVNGPTTQTTLTGLNEYTEYSITVFASTSKGGGTTSEPAIKVTTEQDSPNAPPSNIQGHNTSSTGILVQWSDVPADDQNGVILSYTVTYRALPDGSNQTKTVSARQATLTGLNKYTNYSITVFASTVKGDGIVSAPIIVITDEDTPDAPPSNFQGHNTSSTSILVQWGAVPAADQSGVILSYTVTYRALPYGSNENKTVNTRQATLTGLSEYTNYSITVFASTVKGDGIVSAPIIVITDEDRPSASPANFTGHNASSTSIFVDWGDVPPVDQNGIILRYTITYTALPNGTPVFQVVDAPTNQATLTGLNEYTNYSITVFASTSKGNGNASQAIIVTTDEDRPSAPPANLKGHNTSSTSIFVDWGDVQAADRNGIILRYTVTYTALPNGSPLYHVVDAPTTQASLTGLNEHTNYSITVFASTSKGNGNASEAIIVTTNQDTPDAPPSNFQGHNTSSTSILVQWGAVPAADQNGVILNYAVTYRAIPDGSNKNKTVSARQATLTGLNEYTNYSITVFASTVKGDGIVSAPIIVITDEDRPNAPPANISGHNTSSTSIYVDWDDVPPADQNGVILRYSVTYTELPNENPILQVVDAPATQATLTGLNEYTNYSITVFASTSKGDGNVSRSIIVLTDEDKPNAPPVDVTGYNTSSTSIFVDWGGVPQPDQNGVILRYTVTYIALPNGSPQSLVVNAPTTLAILTGLNEYTNYSMTVFASTSKGDGNVSNPIIVITDQAKPSAPPVNVSGHNTSSTSIFVDWDNVPPADQKGVILRYTITYTKLPDRIQQTKVVYSPTTEATLTRLHKFTNYSITVFASTSKGDGNASEAIIVITDQDKPSSPPADVTGHNTSSTSIFVDWDDIPPVDQNGIILRYTVTYTALPNGNTVRHVVDAPTTQATLTGLNEYTNYSITVFASTSKGGGNVSTPIIVITDEDKPDGAPQNVRGHNTSSSSILVLWDEVQVDLQNGIITGYTITYKSQTENPNGTVPAGPSDRQKEITGLKEYVDYNITVFASTVKGDGPHSNPILVVRTDQDKPANAPPNVRGHNTSSTSILVLWDEVPVEQQNGIITGYTITYQSQTENHNGDVQAGPNDREKNVTGLKEYVDYNITVIASTVKGDGPHSAPVLVIRTDQDKPDGAPQNVTGHNTGSTSILVLWEEVPVEKQNGIITGYSIIYKSQTENHNGNVSAGPNDRQTHITGLKEYVDYNITVFATTVKGDGPHSTPIAVVRTDQDRPDGAPQNVRGHNSSSTSIAVIWDEVPAEQQNGIITGYTITYQSQTQSHNGSVRAGPKDRQKEITGLKKYVDYNITVLASTVKGDGPLSFPVLVVRTDQDKPDGAPQNVRGHNTSSTSIVVLWDAVSVEQQNGIITGYTITYQSQTENHNGNVQAGPNDTHTEITGLKEYVDYNIEVSASTAKGDGPRSTPVVVTTDQDKPSNFPLNLRPVDTNFTSILVAWDEVPAPDRNGIILSYTVMYQAIGGVTVNTSINTTTVDFPKLQTNLTDLINDTKYNISVLASTVKGDGPYSDPIFVTTNQDKPSAPPDNVLGRFTSSTEISVTWDVVPEDKQHGEILHYTVIFWKTEGGDQKAKRVKSPTQNVKLTGLAKYTYYSISLKAATVKGDGPASTAINVRTDEDKPDASPTISKVTVLNSTSILLEWEPVALEFRNGIITKYAIHYRDEVKRAESIRVVNVPAVNATINGLKQKTKYSFWILAATSKGYGPSSNIQMTTTDAVPTVSPPADDAIGETQASVKFVNKRTLSNGNPVRYFQMILTTLPNGLNPGNSADEKYQNVTLVYENQVEGEPYITAEFARDESRTTFTVGDGKYYSRSGITEAKRKRRAVSSVIKYLNGKLEKNKGYAVFQRSFDKDGDYESEGFIQFKTREETEKPQPKTTNRTAIIASVVTVVLVLLILAGAIFFWRRRSSRHYVAKTSSSNLHVGSTQENIEMSSTEQSYYNSFQLHDELTVPRQVTYENVQAGRDMIYENFNPKRDDISQKNKQESHYQPLDLNRQANYEEAHQRVRQRQTEDYYQPLNQNEKRIYGNQSRY